VSWVTIHAILDAIRKGPAEGERYSPSRQAKTWVGHLIVEHTGKSPELAAEIASAWGKNGLLVVGDYYNRRSRNTVAGITVNEVKAAEMPRPDRHEADEC
jgi:hypothetical protein